VGEILDPDRSFRMAKLMQGKDPDKACTSWKLLKMHKIDIETLREAYVQG